MFAHLAALGAILYFNSSMRADRGQSLRLITNEPSNSHVCKRRRANEQLFCLQLSSFCSFCRAGGVCEKWSSFPHNPQCVLFVLSGSGHCVGKNDHSYVMGEKNTCG